MQVLVMGTIWRHAFQGKCFVYLIWFIGFFLPDCWFSSANFWVVHSMIQLLKVEFVWRDGSSSLEYLNFVLKKNVLLFIDILHPNLLRRGKSCKKASFQNMESNLKREKRFPNAEIFRFPQLDFPFLSNPNQIGMKEEFSFHFSMKGFSFGFEEIPVLRLRQGKGWKFYLLKDLICMSLCLPSYHWFSLE